MSFRLDVVKNNNQQVIQIGIRGGTTPTDTDPPYRDCFGFALLPAATEGRGLQPNDHGFEGSVTPFIFEEGKSYDVELSILADSSRELRVWLSGSTRPTVPNATAPAKATIIANGTKYHIGFDAGGGAETAFRIDDFRVEKVGH